MGADEEGTKDTKWHARCADVRIGAAGLRWVWAISGDHGVPLYSQAPIDASMKRTGTAT